MQARQTVGQPYLRIIVNRDAVARYGLNASQVLDVVQALGGRTVGSISNNDGRFDIRVRLTPQDRTDVARVGALRVSNGAGKAVPLAEVADIRMEPGPSTIEREQGQRVIMVQANVRGRDFAGFVLAAQHAVATQVKLPLGYRRSKSNGRCSAMRFSRSFRAGRCCTASAPHRRSTSRPGQYRLTLINAFQNVADVLQSVQADAKTLEASVAAEQAASRSLDIARRKLQTGEIAYLSVLTAQQSYETAHVAAIQARAARLADTAALFQAVGGGWWNRSDALVSSAALKEAH